MDRLILADASVLDRILAELQELRAVVKALETRPGGAAEHPLLTGADVAKLARCRRGRVYEAIASGALPSTTRDGRGGPVHLVTAEDARAWAQTLSRRN